ncbi:MAG: SHOCT domain-containing protein [Bacillota bacterium]
MARLIRRMARTAAISGTATAASGRVRHRQEQQFAAEAAQASREAKPVSTPEDEMDHQIAQLEKLAQLKEKGVLTEEEFAAKKKKILGL